MNFKYLTITEFRPKITNSKLIYIDVKRNLKNKICKNYKKEK